MTKNLEDFYIPEESIDEMIDILNRCFYISFIINEDSFTVVNSKKCIDIPLETDFFSRNIWKTKLPILIKSIILKRVRFLQKKIHLQLENYGQKMNDSSNNYYHEHYKLADDKSGVIFYNEKGENNYSGLTKIYIEMKDKKYYLKQLDNFKHLSKKSNTNCFEDVFVLYFNNLINIIICHNILDFINKEKKERNSYFSTLNENSSKNIFYRGNKLNYDLSTSLYREKKLPKLEHIINNRIILNMPDSFLNCNSFFDKMVILKHFNCPSRLLDITTNPLIASFFALDNYGKEKKSTPYGAINICYVKNSQVIKNAGNSDSLNLLSALSTTNKDLIAYDVGEGIRILGTFIDLIDSYFDSNNKQNKTEIDLTPSFVNAKSEVNNMLDFFIDDEENIDIYNTIISFIKVEDKFKLYCFLQDENVLMNLSRIGTMLINLLNSKNYFHKELQHQATLLNYVYSENELDDGDIHKYFVVYPSINNQRIRNQQGLFIITGSEFDTKTKRYINPNLDYLKLFQNNKKRTLFLLNNKNDEFYDELNYTYGINRGLIYPELESKINQIKNNIFKEYDVTN